MLQDMLRSSVVGTFYRWWLASGLYALLRRWWHGLCRAARNSRLLRAMFGPTKADAWFSGSAYARFWRRCCDRLLAIMGGLWNVLRGSAACRFLYRQTRSSALLHYETLLGSFCCLMFIIPHDYWNNLFAAAGSVALFGGWLLLCAGGRRRFVYPDELGLGLALFLVACVLSMLVTPEVGDSARILILYLGAFLLCWMIATGFDTLAALRRLCGLLYLCMLVVCLFGLAQRFFGLVMASASYTDLTVNRGVPGRVFATLDSPNNLSGFLQIFLPLGAAYAAGADKPWKRGVLCAGLLLPAAAMIMTYSRSGWLSILMAAAVFLYFTDKRLLPLLILLLPLVIPFLPDSVLTRLSSITNSEDSSRNHRFAIWEGVMTLLLDKGHWLTGIGLGPKAFLAVYPEYAVGAGLYGAYHSQMLYMEVILELGIVGFLSFLWMLLKFSGRLGRAIVRESRRELRLYLLACLAVTAGLAISFVFEYLWFYQRCIYAYFIYLGILIAALRCSEREPADSTVENFPERI